MQKLMSCVCVCSFFRELSSASPWPTKNSGDKTRGSADSSVGNALILQPGEEMRQVFAISRHEGQPYCTLLYKGLEHPWIWMSEGCPGTNPPRG